MTAGYGLVVEIVLLADQKMLSIDSMVEPGVQGG